MTNPLSRDEDYFILLQEPRSGSMSDVQEDVDYFLKNLYAALKIPKEFLEHDS